MQAPFVHLHVHSEYSLADGVVRVKALVRSAQQLNMPAVAVTDLANLYGMVKFYQAAVAGGIKPIVGVDAWILNPDSPAAPTRLVLLAATQDGYRALCRLLARAHTEGQHGGCPCINKSWFDGNSAGLVALSGALHGDVGHALLRGNVQRARQLCAEYQDLFPERFFLELYRVGTPQEEEYIDMAVELAYTASLPVVASNFVHFLHEADYEAHEVRTCIQQGRVLTDNRRPRRYTPQQYLRTAAEMVEVFADIPEAVANTVEVAKCCNLTLNLGEPYLPAYPVDTDITVEQLLQERAKQGLSQWLSRAELQHRSDAYQNRLDDELDVICGMGFSSYFLIVWDFVQWAKNHDIPVGPGRGSGAGSLVAFALGITELDPIAHGLLFERFLNPERVSLPDFDIDFCIEGRDRVIEYVAQRYGRDKVSQIITHGTMAARAVVRDVGRVMDLPYGHVDKIAKLVPFEVGMTLDKALEQEELLQQRYDEEEDVRELIDMARALEGIARNVGKHAGGVVIAPTKLVDYTPLYCEHGGTNLVTQLDKDDLEAIGLVKFDFLGLRTLTIIDKTVKLINAGFGGARAKVDLERIDTEDADTYKLIKSGRTTALFQLESRGMREVIQRLQPDRFDDLVALVALYRPGPMRMIDDFVNCKHGRTKIEYAHPLLEPILRSTYGVILYQEQVMEIARVMAGYSLGTADLLRSAMGKKKPEEMARQRTVFLNGASERNVDSSVAGYIFDLMERFAGYGFGKSHSAAYALISYQTAWLKTYFSAAFMAASLSADMENTDRIVRLLAECRELHINVQRPDINLCEYAFVPIAEDEILYGLGAIKGIGRGAIETIIDARDGGKPFKNLFEFCERIDIKRVNRRIVESLIRAGALDGLGSNRASLVATLPVAMDAAGQQGLDRDFGQSDFFGVKVTQDAQQPLEVDAWSEEERLKGEKETLGLYLTGHPMDQYRTMLAQFVNGGLGELSPTEHRSVIVAGLVVGLRTRNTRRGERMAFVTLDDQTARLDVTVFSDLYSRSRDALRPDNLVVVQGKVSVDDYTGGCQMRAEAIYGITDAQAAFAKRLVIDIPQGVVTGDFVPLLQQALSPYTAGSCEVYIHYYTNGAEVGLAMGPQWNIQATSNVVTKLNEIAGEGNIRLLYR